MKKIRASLEVSRKNEKSSETETYEEKDSSSNTETIYVDLMGSLYDDHNVHPNVSHPFREFTKFHPKFKLKPNTLLLNEKALEYIQNLYFQEYKNHGSRDIFRDLISKTETEIEKKGILKAMRLFWKW